VRHPGIVYIVGAGPGNPDLITVRGLLCLRDADVVLHDRLIDLHLLEEARPDAEIINVGKENGNEDLQQEHINWLMIEKSRQGKNVCRLKGGDPFVFGRGGEEARALSQAGVPFEIVPGVSSALAVPAYAGIPVTDRDRAHSFMVIAGSRSHDLNSPEWQAAAALARAGGTVVVLMGLARLPAITERLISGGCGTNLPIAVISNGTYLIQDCRAGTLADISQKLVGIKAPVTIVIGEVVSLQNRVQWMEFAERFGA
jgi:uroporphyrin-III C-methyltransferase